MKTKDFLEAQEKYGDLKISEILEILNRPFICPKCKGTGIERKLIYQGNWGYSDDVYENIDCDVCDGHGYTTKEKKPVIKTKIIGFA